MENISDARKMTLKYLVMVVFLSASFLFGVFVFIQNQGTQFLGANLSSGIGRWTEIKPRISGTASSTSDKVNKSEEIAVAVPKNAKKEKPAVDWCNTAEIQAPERKVVINELAWMGTAESYSNEWIELKNISDMAIDLAGWQLQNKNKKIKIAFNADTILDPGEFYLLERTADDSAPGVSADMIYVGSIGNSNEGIYLFDNACRLQDSAVASGKWPAGDNTSKKTMARSKNLVWKNSVSPGGTPKSENK